MTTFRGNTSWLTLIGAGFFWAWLDCVVSRGTLFDPFGMSEMLETAYLVTFAVSVLPAVVTLLKPVVIDRLTGKPLYGPLVGGLGAFGCLLVSLGGAFGQPAILVVGSVVTGVQLGTLLVLWGRVCVTQGSTHAIIHITGAYAVSLIVDLFVVFLQPIPAVVFLTLCPLISGLLFWLLAHHSADGAALELSSAATFHELGTDVSPTEKVSFDAQLVAIITSFYCVIGFTSYINGLTPMDIAGGLAYFISWEVAGLALFVGCAFFGWRARKVGLFGLVMFGIAAVTVLIPASPEMVYSMSGSFMVAGSAAFDVLVWSLVALSHHFTRRPYVGTVAIVAVCQQVGTLVGYACGLVFPQVGTDLTVYASAAFIICACLAAGIVYVRHSNKKLLSALFADESVDDLPSEPTLPVIPSGVLPSFTPTTAEIEAFESGAKPSSPYAGLAPLENVVAPAQSNPAPEAAPAKPELSPRESTTLEQIADEYRLTRREREVFAHLAKGRSAPYIAERYQVSENTVRSHIKHIYTKLDVHSRQELLTFVRDAG